MFGFLGSKVQKYLVVRELKCLRKSVLTKGGAAKVCYEYWKFLEKDTLYQELGIVAEADAPHPKMVAILSALDLLNSWKLSSNEDQTMKDLMELLSRQVYVSALLSVNHDDLLKLYRDVGGVDIGITADPVKATAVEKALRAEITARKDKAMSAWSHWRESTFDVFDAIKSA